MGNCGVGFAPCRQDDHDVLVDVMAGVEDIPGVVMTDGLPWNWETFPEYMDALDAGRRDIDVAAYLPHSPLRVYVMGQRGADREPATADDLAKMRKLAKEAIEVGALGFASSRLTIHKTESGSPIPSFEAAREEIEEIARGVVDGGGGLLQLVPDLPPAAIIPCCRRCSTLPRTSGCRSPSPLSSATPATRPGRTLTMVGRPTPPVATSPRSCSRARSG